MNAADILLGFKNRKLLAILIIGGIVILGSKNKKPIGVSAMTTFLIALRNLLGEKE